MSSTKSKYSILLTIILIIVIISLFVIFVDMGEVWLQLSRMDFKFLLLSSIMLIFGLIGFAYRWYLLLDKKPSLKDSFHSANIGHMFNLILPLRAGEVIRIIVLRRRSHIPTAEITTSVVVEKVVEQIMRIGAIGGALVFGVGINLSLLTVGGAVIFLAVAFVGLLWIVRHPDNVSQSWPKWLSRLPGIDEERARKLTADMLLGLSSFSSVRSLLIIFLVSVITWSFFWAFYYICLIALNMDLSLREGLAISLGALALAPPSASTLPGIYHASIVVPLVAAGYSETMITSLTIMLYALKIFWMVTLGLWGLSQGRLSIRMLIQQTHSSDEKDELDRSNKLLSESLPVE